MARRAHSLALASLVLVGLTLTRAQEPLPESGSEPEAEIEAERQPAEGRAPTAPLDVALRLPAFRWLPREDFLSQVTLTRLPPGSLVIRYAGVEGFVLRRAQGRLRELWHDTIDDAWEGGVLDDEEYEAALGRMYDALADHRAGGRWWERSWQDSLTVARGGAPPTPFEHLVGRRIELRLGPLVVTNELRAYVANVAVLSVDPDAARLLRGTDPGRLAREHAWVVRDDRDPDEAPVLEEGPEDPDDARGLADPIVRVTFSPPEPVALRARWRLTIRPSMSLRTLVGLEDLVRDLRLRATLELYRGAGHLKFLQIEAVVRYRPDGDEVTVALEVVLFTW